MMEKLASLRSVLKTGEGKPPKVFSSVKDAIAHTTKELEKFTEKLPKPQSESIWGGKKR